MLFRRDEFNMIKERMEEPRDSLQALVGPRQVGKSTLVNQVLQSLSIPYRLLTADAVNPENGEWISEQWRSVRQEMKFKKYTEFLLVIDEIQKINNWSEYVKREWDEDTRTGLQLKVFILGSSRLMVQHGLTESLAGRFELIRMGHWTFAEMQEAFGWDINQYIYFGGYPGAAKKIGNEGRWKTYIKDAIIEPAISRDVLMTSNIYKPALLRQLFELGSVYSGELVSLNKMLGQLQDSGNVTTLASYLELLKESGLLCGLQKFSIDNARKYNSIPKYQVFNNALLSAQSDVTYEQAFTTPRLWGRWVESAVGAYFMNNSVKHNYKVFYWRDSDDEVDFILVRGGKVIAVEVKSGRRGKNRGMPKFREMFKPYRDYYVGTDGIPLDTLLLCDVERLFE